MNLFAIWLNMYSLYNIQFPLIPFLQRGICDCDLSEADIFFAVDISPFETGVKGD